MTLALSGGALAGDEPGGAVGLLQMQHTLVEPGGQPVGAVLMFTQDRDGFLWMTTFKGEVLRFDGQTLTRPLAAQLKPFEVPVALLLGPHGESNDMWIGHRRNGVTHIVNGVVTHYDGGGLPGGSFQLLLRDRHGVIWAMTPQGVARFVHGQWEGAETLGWDHAHPELLAIATDGDVYAIDAEKGAMVSRGGNTAFVPAERADVVRAEAGLPAGEGWVPPSPPDSTHFRARDGSLWFAPDSGIERFRWSTGESRGAPDIHERMTYAQGLSSPQVYGMGQDREGDIWLATMRGLDRFRTTPATPLVFPEPLEFPAMAVASDGAVWVTTATQAPFRYSGRIDARIDGLGKGVSAVVATADGSLVFAGRDGLSRWRNGTVTRLPVPAALSAVGTRFRQVLEAPDGSLWIVAASFGLYHVQEGSWTRMNGRDGLPSQMPSFVRRLPDGGVGVAYADGGLYSVRGEVVRHLFSLDAAAGAPSEWLSEPGGMWVGGSRELMHVGADGARPVRQSDGRPFVAVSGLLRDREGALWVFHQDGIDRLSPRGLHINIGEGLGENAAGLIPVSSLAQDRRGLIWAATSTGVTWIDPRHVAINTVRPKVFVDALVHDDKVLPAVDGSLLPALVHTLRIDYTAPMLRRPEQARFEYRLDGVDDAWQQAGGRRSAYYTRPGPGAYVFHVRAFNEDGVPSENEAVVRFQIAPAWYQTRTFVAVAMAALVAMLWLVYRLRLRMVTRQLRIRSDERERIARDLHDTLLQGFQGLVLRFTAIRRHAGSDRARDMIDHALLRADEALVEGREKVTALRGSGAGARREDFRLALEAIGEEHADLHEATYRVVIQGRARRLRSDVCEDLVLIVREAVRNAMQHANASAVRVDAQYTRRRVTVRVTDNGQGFSQALGREGHWGLLGMRERAAMIGAHIDIASSPGQGSTISVSLPATRAYL